MMDRRAIVACAGLALVSPVLAFPRIVGLDLVWVPVLTAIAALAAAVWLLRADRGLAGAVAVFALAAIAGWSRAAGQVDTVNHFAGLALGVLAMATIAHACRTRGTLALATGAMVALGLVAMTVAIGSVTPIHEGKAISVNPLAAPDAPTPLPLGGLHGDAVVNPNALGATAMLILPVAGALTLIPAGVVRWQGALRLGAGLTAVWAAVVVILTQSRSVWLSAIVVAALLLRGRLRARAWWAMVFVAFVAAPVTVTQVLPNHPAVTQVAETVRARAEIWRDGVVALQTSPWRGIGFDYLRHSGLSMMWIAPDKEVGTPHAHNILLQIALDVGLFGLAGYLAIMGLVLGRAVSLVRSRDRAVWVRRVAAGAALSLVSVHVFGIVDAVPLGAKVGLFQWWSCGLILAAWRVRSSSDLRGVEGA